MNTRSYGLTTAVGQARLVAIFGQVYTRYIMVIYKQDNVCSYVHLTLAPRTRSTKQDQLNWQTFTFSILSFFFRSLYFVRSVFLFFFFFLSSLLPLFLRYFFLSLSFFLSVVLSFLLSFFISFFVSVFLSFLLYCLFCLFDPCYVCESSFSLLFCYSLVHSNACYFSIVLYFSILP